MLYDLGSTGNVLLTQREHLFLSKTDDFRGSQGELDHNVMRLFSQFLDYQIFVVLGKTGTFQYVMSKRPKTGFHSIASKTVLTRNKFSKFLQQVQYHCP